MDMRSADPDSFSTIQQRQCVDTGCMKTFIYCTPALFLYSIHHMYAESTVPMRML